jgi:CubicO group peptidase (beta-lactamase class C family)
MHLAFGTTLPMTRRVLSSVLLLSVACGGAEPQPQTTPTPPTSATANVSDAGAAPVAAAKTYTMTADGPVKTARGATFPVAAGWHVTEKQGEIVLQDPERELSLAYVEVEAEHAKAAIETAWKMHDSKFALAPKREIAPPPVAPWEEIVQIVYEATPSTRVVLANARRIGKTVWVAILEAPASALDRRGAQVQNTFDKLEGPGIARESWAGRTAATLDDAKQKALVAFAERALAELHVPGASISVVQGGKTVLEAAIGVKELGKPAKVTPTTLFLIGSTTKSLSTLLMAKAVDEGKFGWDTKVRAVDPTFALGDKELTERLEMRHLVCACTGVPRYDMELLFTFGGVKAEDTMKQLAELRPTTKFGETFQYNNQLVAAGGYLAAHAFYPKLPLGQAYDRALREKVLGPLGMNDSTLALHAAQGRAASTHGQGADGEMRVLPFSYEDFVLPVAPSGGLLSSTRDMAKYLVAELQRGKSVMGVQVASEANVVRRREPQVKMSSDMGYGMGLASGLVKGVPFVEHNGATFGHRSAFTYLPDHGVGLTVLANGPGPLGSLVKARLLELLFDGKPEAEAALAFVVAEEKKGVTQFKATLAEPEPKEVVQTLLGRYHQAALGDVSLEDKGGTLWFDAGEWKSRVAFQKRAGGSKNLVLLDAPVAGLAFERREQDGKPALYLSFQQHEYLFTR